MFTLKLMQTQILHFLIIFQIITSWKFIKINPKYPIISSSIYYIIGDILLNIIFLLEKQYLLR